MISKTQQLIVVRNSVERVFFRIFIFIVPGIYLFRTVLQLVFLQTFPDALTDYIRIFSELAYIIGMVFAGFLFAAIPGLISQLFLNKNLLTADSDNQQDTSQSSFINRFDLWLNHRFRIVMGVLASAVVLGYYIVRVGGIWQFLYSVSFSVTFLDRVLYIFPGVGYGYFFGIVAWKVLVISHFATAIPGYFKVNVEFEHPDGAGGLLPIGMLCLQMIYVAIVPTLASGLILLGPLLNIIFDAQVPIANSVLIFGLSPLIIFVGVLGSAIGLFPLLKFHRVMTEQKIKMIEVLNEISQKIIELKKGIVEASKNANQDSDETLKEIGALETFYKTHEKINTWPINKQVLVRIWTTQTILWGQVIWLYNLVRNLPPSQ